MDKKSGRTIRCEWADSDPLMGVYHDTEWGVPLYDDQRLFEFLVLEGMQAGLSWLTVLKKREAFRNAFDSFDPRKVARYSPRKVDALRKHAGIIRNRKKIEAAITNAQAFLHVQKTHGSFARFIWGFIGSRPVQNSWQAAKDLPAQTPKSDIMSLTLQKHGFCFVGSTICYAHMQATGMVNDHIVSCFRHSQVRRMVRPRWDNAAPVTGTFHLSLVGAITLRRGTLGMRPASYP